MSHSLAFAASRGRRTVRTVMLAAAVAAMMTSTAGPAWSAAPTFAQFKVSVWPEFDDPRALTIFEPTLDSSVQLPYKFSYGVPLAAQVNMGCQLTASGQHQ